MPKHIRSIHQLPLEPSLRHQPITYLGQNLAVRRGEVLPARSTHNDYERWQRLGRQVLIKGAAIVSVLGSLAGIGTAKWIANLPDEPCQSYAWQDVSFSQLQAAEDINKQWHDARISGFSVVLKDFYETGYTTVCGSVNISNVNALVTGHEVGLDSDSAPTTTTQPS